MINAWTTANQTVDKNIHIGPTGLLFRSILVATDCSPASAVAVRLAARLAKEFHAQLFVLHAVEPALYGVDVPGPLPELAMLDLQNARGKLHDYAAHIPEVRTVKHEELIFLGSIKDAIQSAGHEHAIDLLVLGSHGRQGMAKLGLGSLSEWAIRRLTYPVLVAGPGCDPSIRPIRSILLATDLSTDAARSARYAVSLAQEQSGGLTLMTVTPHMNSVDEQAKCELNAMTELRRLVPHEQCDSLTLQFQVATGEIATSVLEWAKQSRANLIVLGAQHRPPLSDHLPRTKLSTIICEARCPVLVVPSLVDCAKA